MREILDLTNEKVDDDAIRARLELLKGNMELVKVIVKENGSEYILVYEKIKAIGTWVQTSSVKIPDIEVYDESGTKSEIDDIITYMPILFGFFIFFLSIYYLCEPRA